MNEGLFHPNCTHRLIAVPESIAKKYYNSKGQPVGSNNPERRKQHQRSKLTRLNYECALIDADPIGEHSREQHLTLYEFMRILCPESHMEISLGS